MENKNLTTLLKEAINDEYKQKIYNLLNSNDPNNISLAIQLADNFIAPNYVYDNYISKAEVVAKLVGKQAYYMPEESEPHWWVDFLKIKELSLKQDSHLNIKGDIEQLFDALTAFKQLERLLITLTGVQYIPDNVGNLQHLPLNTFAVRENKSLEYISNEISFLKNLTTLLMPFPQQNPDEFLKAVSDLPKLNKLYITHAPKNSIELPESFSNLTNLKNVTVTTGALTPNSEQLLKDMGVHISYK